MKHLVLGLTFGAIALAQHPNVSDCFKVHETIRADEEHYWTTWTNACPYTIDSVYVVVGFSDHASKEIASGVFALHFVAPGAHRTMRFSAPGKISDFASVRQRKITGDMGEAFGRPLQAAKPAMTQMEIAAVSAYKEAIVKEGVHVTAPAPALASTVARVISDAGEGAYQVLKSEPGEARFKTDFPDAWRSVLSAQEAAVSPAPRASFVRFVSDEKPLFQ